MIHNYLLALGIFFSTCSAFAATKTDVDLSILDSKVNPCDDFYQYACGGWLAKTEIPADRPMWNRSFSTIDLNNREIVNKILKGYAEGKTEPANPYVKLLGDFYGACMDEKLIEKSGLPAFKAQLAELDKVTDVKDLAPAIARLHENGVHVLFNFDEEQDAKDSSQVIGVADQGGLGLPDRDYYLKTDPKMAEIRKLYVEHIEKMFKLLGEKNAAADAEKIMKIETALAQASMSRVDRRDPNKVYHRLERKGLVERAPLFNWGGYFDHLGVDTTPKLTAINVAVPEFFVGMNEILRATPLADLKTYVKWHFLTAVTEALPKRFVDERFRFVSKALSGQKKLEARWKRCERLADGELGFAVGRSFVEVAYGEEGKQRSKEMIGEVEHAFHGDLESLDWMDSKTRKEAEKKLDKINNKIGYPNIWRSYEGVVADRHSFLTSLENASEFNSKFYLNKIGKPVDPNDWDMTPPTVNAYYDPPRNEMVFPAGIFQYPFFNREGTDSLNYGAIGVVMGHELTHGFDDEGRNYDANGNLVNWWEPKVLKNFEEKTACVEKEYSGFEALPGIHVNGKLTLGENIADQGGMKLSYTSWKAKHPNDPEGEKKFFLAFAQSWCQKEQEPYTRMRVFTDPHSPSRYRVNGVVSQFEPFAKAYSCPAGSKMAPANRCVVW